jgi:DNA-directed RNA polymerase specialized sigma24 family protein
MEIGPKVRDHRRKPTDEATLKDLAKRYAEGASIRQIAVATGWSYGTVYSRLSMAQVSGLVVLRPRGGVVGPRNSG